jgi:hypothetical protein
MLAEFGSVVDAVRSAIEVQRGMRIAYWKRRERKRVLGAKRKVIT